MFQRWRNYDVGVMDLADLLECSICLGQEESSVCLSSEKYDFADPNIDSGPFFLYVKPSVSDPDPKFLVYPDPLVKGRLRIRLGIPVPPSLNKNYKYQEKPLFLLFCDFSVASFYMA
jgi:hypothetical protein